jgi:hypothetical protein
MGEIQSEDLILVAVMNSRQDLEIARVLGWYRIPLANAPKTIRADWIAFYQTAAFGTERWVIRYASQVLGHELVSRKELLHQELDHPRVDEPYYKVQLGDMQELSRPIPSRTWRRITFLYTTGERLLRAADVRDLPLPEGENKDRLWRMLREKEGEHRQT